MHSTIFVIADQRGQLRGVFETVGEGIDPRQVQAQILAAVRELEREGVTGAAISEALGFSGPAAYYHWRRQQQAGLRFLQTTDRLTLIRSCRRSAS